MNRDRGSQVESHLNDFGTGPYLLKHVLEDIPLNSDGTPESVSISYVEHWNDNLYIGTSASEILHLVAIPGDNDFEPPIFILASRLQPNGQPITPPTGQLAGVQKILLLPGTLKACILCNGVISFYTLPELSPAFAAPKLTGVQWIGGIDENADTENDGETVMMIANMKRILLARVGEKLRQHGSVDYPGCLRSCRRDTIACVADDTGYSLLEVEHQQRIQLSSISTHRSEEQNPPTQSASIRLDSSPSHGRSKSLGHYTPTSNGSPTRASTTTNLELPVSEHRAASPTTTREDGNRPPSRPRSSTDGQTPLVARNMAKLRPNILSPSPEEFMFTTGTVKDEPGVGVFVNLEGDVSRGTIEFDRYPESVLVYDFAAAHASASLDGSESQYVIAVLDKSGLEPAHGKGLEIQQLRGTLETTIRKTWLPFPEIDPDAQVGLHQCSSHFRYVFREIADLLRLVRYKSSITGLSVEPDPRTKASIERLEQENALFDSSSPRSLSPTPEYIQRRNEEETAIVSRLGHVKSGAIAWSGRKLWLILPNPLILQLEHKLSQCGIMRNGSYSFHAVDVTGLISLLGSIREQEPQDETDYLALNFIRQKASMILFFHLNEIMISEKNIEKHCKMVGNALEDGQIDPRIVLSLIPPLAGEVLQGRNGIWLPQGIVDLLASFRFPIKSFDNAPTEFWLMIRQYLKSWQTKRGYGSISDEKFVLDSVDAALLHTLLYLDQALPEGSRTQVTVRAKLNNVVDHWKGDFQRAIVLLEHYRRLFVLSRLYQSRRLTQDVLATWKRIVEGDVDEDKSLTIEMVEIQIRKFLTKIRNTTLVQEYGIWLAKRNPSLAVEVFTDDESHMRMTPAQVVTMLKDHAPGAVQQYLEHLVFNKNLDQYSDDLIGYYLDSVLCVLETSSKARETLEQTYTTYRALTSPKPSYLNFITENAPQDTWWQSRLRLLQLLGSGSYATAFDPEKELTYSVEKVLERLTPFSSYLVSESIILDARQGRHKEALHLLTHGLGDYDTAVRYCYFGGPASMSSQAVDASLLPPREIQGELLFHLLCELLRIEDHEEQMERASHLLGTFATWFDPINIFNQIPDDWTVSRLSEFLLRSLRAARSERNEAVIIKALNAAQNLQQQAVRIGMCEKFGPQYETELPERSDSGDLNSLVS